MPRLNDHSENLLFLTEMRLKMASKIAGLKVDIERYEQLAKSTPENSALLTDLRLSAVMELARLKIEINKFQELGKPSAQSNGYVEDKKDTPAQSNGNNGHHKGAINKVSQGSGKIKVSESNWVNKQAMKLLGNSDERTPAEKDALNSAPIQSIDENELFRRRQRRNSQESDKKEAGESNWLAKQATKSFGNRAKKK